MKKNYLILASMFTSMLSFAQSNGSELNVGKHQTVGVTKLVNHVERQKGGPSPLWENDFSTPADWSFAINGSAPHNWVIGTGVPSGSFPLAGINSTTKLNGFALFDSDLLCGAAGSQNSDVRTVAPIDLTGSPAVQVTFESWYRAFQGTCWVIASTDGVTWTEFPVTSHNGLAVNATLPTNPTVASVNISSVVGNSATAYIGFRYKGGCDYAWMVDDVAIEVLPDNDMAVGKVWAGDIVLDWDYSMVPVAQTKPMMVGAVISNSGATVQTGVNAVLKVMLGGAEVYTQTDTRDYSVAEIDTVWFTTTYTPTGLGDYTVEVSVPEDDVVGNEMGEAAISTTQHIYGHDYLGTGIFRFDQDEETGMGNLYNMEATATLRGVQVEFETGTTPETEVVIRVSLVNSNIQDLTFIDELYYTVPASKIGPNKTTNILLNSPLTLDAGSAYIIEVRKQAGPSRVFFGGSDLGDDDNSTVNFGPFGAGDAINWYTGWGFSPAVRANFDPSLSVSTLVDIKGVNVYPNPSEGLVTISNDLNAENTITVTDITGKVVFSKVSSSATTVDLSKVGTGVYMVEVSNENGKKVERVVIR